MNPEPSAERQKEKVEKYDVLSQRQFHQAQIYDPFRKIKVTKTNHVDNQILTSLRTLVK